MFYLYIKQESNYDSKKLINEYNDIDDAYDKIDELLANDEKTKYILEKTTGHVDSYGELIATVVEKNF